MISFSQKSIKLKLVKYKTQVGDFCLHHFKDTLWPRKIKKQKQQEMSLKKTNGVGLKKEENITQARLRTCT